MLLAVAAQTGCRGVVPEQVLTKPGPVPLAAAPSLGAGPWEQRPNGIGSSYAIVQTATIRIAQDSSVRIDSIASQSAVFLAVSPGGRFAGTITAFSTKGAGQAFAPPPGVLLPVSFGGTITKTGVVELTLPAAESACASAASAVALSARDLWLRAPDTVRLGATWSDSSTTVTCRDGIPLRMSVRRHYHVERADASGGEMAIVVTRNQRVVIGGVGKQWGEDVRVTGTGAGDMVLRLSTKTGTLLGADGSATLELTFTGTRTEQRVQQRVEARIRLIASK